MQQCEATVFSSYVYYPVHGTLFVTCVKYVPTCKVELLCYRESIILYSPDSIIVEYDPIFHCSSAYVFKGVVASSVCVVWIDRRVSGGENSPQRELSVW